MSEPLLEVRAADVAIGSKTIVHGANLTLERGRLVALVGPNGAGKSTLARAAAGLRKVSAGTVRCEGTDIRRVRGRALGRLRAFVPQRPTVPEGINVRRAVTIGRAPHIKPLGRLTRADHAAVEDAMERAGVSGFADRALTTLSGGELQRVQIAVGLAQQTPVLMADEPTSSLDLGASAGLARTLRSLVEDDRLAILLVVHDLALAAAVADEVVVLSHGRTVATGPASVLDSDRIREVWDVDGCLSTDANGRTGLYVRWLP